MTPDAWYEHAKKALDRERQAPPRPLEKLTLEELIEASRLLDARLESGS